MNKDKAYKALYPAGWIYFDDPQMISEYRNTYGYLVVSNKDDE